MSSKSTPSPEAFRQVAEFLLSSGDPECQMCWEPVYGQKVSSFLYNQEGYTHYIGFTPASKALLCLFFAEAIERGDL